MKRFGTFWTSVLGLVTVAGAAEAQTAGGFALDRFEPSERGSEWFVLDTLDLRGNGRPAVGVVGDYGYKPLVLYDDAGNEIAAPVKHQLFAHVGASVVVSDRLRLGANLPVALLVKSDAGQTGANLGTSEGAGVGDLRFSADVRLFGEYRSLITGAIGLSAWLPTGKRDAFTGDGKVRVGPRFTVAGEAGMFAYSARVGFNYRTQDQALDGQSLGSEIAWAVAAGLRLADDRLLLGPELYGTSITSGGIFEKRGSPVEGVLGGHYLAGDAVRFGVGVGPGLTRGYGSPQVRVLASLEWTPQPEKAPPPPAEPGDRDDDGIVDREDACPDEPGKASDDPKKNGCPPRDRDKDGILDDVDACPDEKGVASDDPEKNGCPLRDKDEDGILDDVDACPDEKGDPSDDPKKNGCPPPPDTDGDGILDPEDACPTAPGPRNSDPKKHGCPEARIEKGQIRIIEQVKFKTGSDVILPESDSILQAVLTIMKEHPEIGKLGIEGHTDNRGGAAFNKNLSKKRAASVMRWLTSRGVEAGRLSSAGYGFERPLEGNDTDEGRAANRRVEFHIVEMDGKPYDSSRD